jgi:hypothetical protein
LHPPDKWRLTPVSSTAYGETALCDLSRSHNTESFMFLDGGAALVFSKALTEMSLNG